MARPWMKVDTGIVHDRKTRATATALNITPHLFVGHLLALWGWAVTFAEDGDLSHFSDAELSSAAGWCKKQSLIAALRDHGWIDPDGTLHEWGTWGGALAVERARDRRRKAGNSLEVPGEIPGKDDGKSAGIPPRFPTQSKSKSKRERNQKAFDQFWDCYPRKVGKPKAQSAYDAAVAAGADPDAILAGCIAYRDDPNRDPRYTAHPTTWLHREGWNDERIPAGGPIIPPFNPEDYA